MKLQGTCDGARGSVDWRGAHADAYQRTSLTGGWKLLEQGPEKSGCFLDLLRWSFGRHGFLCGKAKLYFMSSDKEFRRAKIVVWVFGERVKIESI